MSITRRYFLKKGKKFLLLAAASPAALKALLAKEAGDGPDYKAFNHWWAMFIDIEKCIGCGNCVRACKNENDVPREPYYFRTWVERYHIPSHDPSQLAATEHPVVDSPDGGMEGFPLRYLSGESSKDFFVPKLCNQCAHSPCVQVCPVGATFESPDGVVLVDKSYCLGCRYCVMACPYGCRYIDPRTRTVDKCSLCYHRITKGLNTACCETCPTGARVLGDLKNMADPIHQLLRTHKVLILKPQMATGSKTFYNGLDGAVR